MRKGAGIALKIIAGLWLLTDPDFLNWWLPTQNSMIENEVFFFLATFILIYYIASVIKERVSAPVSSMPGLRFSLPSVFLRGECSSPSYTEIDDNALDKCGRTVDAWLAYLLERSRGPRFEDLQDLRLPQIGREQSLHAYVFGKERNCKDDFVSAFQMLSKDIVAGHEGWRDDHFEYVYIHLLALAYQAANQAGEDVKDMITQAPFDLAQNKVFIGLSDSVRETTSCLGHMHLLGSILQVIDQKGMVHWGTLRAVERSGLAQRLYNLDKDYLDSSSPEPSTRALSFIR